VLELRRHSRGNARTVLRELWTSPMRRPNADVISLAGLSDASLARRIAAAPCLEAAEEARARLADWLAEIADTPAGDALRQVIAGSPALEALLAGLADGSSYLWDLVRASPQRLQQSSLTCLVRMVYLRACIIAAAGP